MNRTMLKSKIHRATVTDSDVHYVGSMIVISYGSYDPDDLEHCEPRVVHVDEHNEIRTIDSEVASLLGANTAPVSPANA
jgi:aspartate 1-decarboxylase